jgi:OOP family OmpA-OmpF porin
MQKILLILCTILISASIWAEDHFYLGPQLTYQYWDKSRFLPGQDDDNGVQAGLNFGYAFASKYAVELVAQTNLSDTNAEAEVYELNHYTYFSESSFGTTPYLVAGVSQVEMDSAVVYDQSTTNVMLGLGISQYLSDYLDLKYDVRMRRAIGAEATGSVNDLGLNLALNFHFGRHEDAPVPAVIAAPTPAPAPPPPPVRVATPAPESVRNLPAPTRSAPPASPQTRDVTVALDVLFETNSSVITDLDDAEFSRMADALRENPGVTLTIEGHTDSAGSAEYNETLSQRRADRVRESLISEYGAPAGRVTAVGYGEARPIANNETAAGRAQNRRVVGVISYQEEL